MSANQQKFIYRSSDADRSADADLCANLPRREALVRPMCGIGMNQFLCLFEFPISNLAKMPTLVGTYNFSQKERQKINHDKAVAVSGLP